MSRTAPPAPMPPDVRLMNGVAALLLVGLLLAALGVGLHRLVRLPMFAIRHIQVEGEVARNSVASLRANALPNLSGTFLSMSLKQGREAFESVPWVRHAVVQRVWPNRLRVWLEEHKPAAYWESKPEGADADSAAETGLALVNSFGEVFEANLGDVEDERLPVLAGPDGASARMLQMWQRLQALSAPLDEGIERLDLSGRGSWRVKLERGAVIELGRGSNDEVQQRYARYTASVTQIVSRYQTQVLSADLRHADGYALRLRGVSTTTTPAKGGSGGNKTR